MSNQAMRTEIWDAPIEKVYETIIDYNAYPEFVDGVSAIHILDEDDNGAKVEYSLNFIKKFSYILKLDHVKPTKVSWEFESGDLFKVNEGSWNLKDLGDGRTEIKYLVDVDVKGFVPKSLIKTLTTKNLPSMLNSYHERAKNR